ncbi:MAG: DUF169 domain-containing protein [Deltaproteobacteria bacterium]|nr:DUF169 domain-containing protein [Deltaproteobacteria bacterium]
MEKWQELGKELDQLLKLRTAPLGVKLLARAEDAPRDASPAGFPCAVCQATGIARYYERSVLVTKDDCWACQVGGRALGFYDLEEDMKTGERNAGLWGADAKAVARLTEGDAIEVGRFSAAVIAPLAQMPVEPDLILAYGTPDQMLSLVYGTIWLGGDRVKLLTNGHGSTCRECIAAPYLHNELRLAITDIGERKFSGAYDYEMIAGLPYGKFAKLIDGVQGALSKGIYHRPIAVWGLQPWPEPALERTGLKARIEK